MMEDQNNIIHDEYQEVDLLDLCSKLIKNWKNLLFWCLGGIIAGIIITLSIPKEYKSFTKFAPESSVKSPGSNLGSLANLAGVNLGSASMDAMYPDLYPEVVASNPFLVDLFSVPVSFEHKKSQVDTDLYDYILHYVRKPWWGVMKTWPNKIAKWVKSIFTKPTPSASAGSTGIDLFRLTKGQQKVVRLLRSSIEVNFDKKKGVIEIDVTTQDPVVAATIAQKVVEQLQTYVTSYRTDKSRHDLAYFQQLYDESKADYYAAQQRYARYVDANQGVVLQRVKVEESRLKNESDQAYQLFLSCTQQLQVAKAKVQQDTPVCSIIQPASVPLKHCAPNAILIIAFFTVLAFCIEVFWILVGKDAFDQIKKSTSE